MVQWSRGGGVGVDPPRGVGQGIWGYGIFRSIDGN